MRLIGLIGKKGSGKDTFFEFAHEFLSDIPDGLAFEEPVRMAFGDALKREVGIVTGMGFDCVNREKKRFRTMLQWWGTEFRREMFGDDYWIRELQKSPEWRYHEALRGKPGLNFVTDVRFLNEARFVSDDCGLLVYIARDTQEVDEHRSEAETLTIPADHIITNDGSLEHFRATVFNLMPKLLGGICAQ